MKKTLLFAGVSCLFSAQVNALEVKPYVGLDVGGSHAEYNGLFEAADIDENFVVSNLNLGLRFEKYLGIEFSAQGSSEVDAGEADFSYSSVNADVLVYAPLYEKAELFGLAGVGYYTFDLKNDLGHDYELHLQNNETAFRLGGGIQYNINEKWAVRGAVRHVFIDNDYIDTITEFTLGVRYNF